VVPVLIMSADYHLYLKTYVKNTKMSAGKLNPYVCEKHYKVHNIFFMIKILLTAVVSGA
jgi:hypothetical protein